MNFSLIDHIEIKEFLWLYKPLFPKNFSMNVIYTFPYIVKIKHFLDAKECSEIIELSQGKYERSTMFLDKKIKHNHRRTSETAILCENGCEDLMDNDEGILSRVVRRVCVLLSCSPSQIEGLMVVKYEEGQEFKNHWDYFEDEDLSLIDGGQRIGTFFVWLNDLNEEDGGATIFPEIGVKCVPECGSALFWWNQYGETLLKETKHRGEPVKNGTKYGMNIWIRYPGW